MIKYRKIEMKKFKMTWVSEESYKALREQKRKQGKSMMRILDNLIKEKYGQSNNGTDTPSVR